MISSSFHILFRIQAVVHFDKHSILHYRLATTVTTHEWDEHEMLPVGYHNYTYGTTIHTVSLALDFH